MIPCKSTVKEVSYESGHTSTAVKRPKRFSFYLVGF